MSPHATAGVVLTGGSSRRMGSDKAVVEVGGRPMAVRVADALWEAGCHPVVCQGGDVAALRGLGLEAVADAVPGRGPVVAIAEALERLAHPIVVAACDLVDLDPATVRAVVQIGAREPHRVAVAVADGRRHLLSYWPVESLDALRSAAAGDDVRYHDVLDTVGAVPVTVEPAAVRNVNTPDDLRSRG